MSSTSKMCTLASTTSHHTSHPPSALAWTLHDRLAGLRVPHPPLSISNQRKCKTAEQTKLPSFFKPFRGFLPCFRIQPKHLASLLPPGICLAPDTSLITGAQPVPATGPLHWPGTLFSRIFPWWAPPHWVLCVLCVTGIPLNSYDTFQRTLT